MVDDDEDIRDLLRDWLVERGHDVEVADTAVRALAAARERRPDVVLLDLAMPGALTGDQVVGLLSASAPVVVVTANIDADLARRLLGEGAFDYVMKPFELDRLSEIIDAAAVHGAAPDVVAVHGA